MTSQEAKGSFMQTSDVVKYFIDTFTDDLQKIRIILTDIADRSVIIDKLYYVSTELVQSKMPEQEWRTMQSEVTTSMFGLGKSLWADETIPAPARLLNEMGTDIWLDQDFV